MSSRVCSDASSYAFLAKTVALAMASRSNVAVFAAKSARVCTCNGGKLFQLCLSPRRGSLNLTLKTHFGRPRCLCRGFHLGPLLPVFSLGRLSPVARHVRGAKGPSQCEHHLFAQLARHPFVTGLGSSVRTFAFASSRICSCTSATRSVHTETSCLKDEFEGASLPRPNTY